MTWQELETKVKTIASYLWDCAAVSETVAGVKCDCVLKVALDRWIFVEISQESNLDKLRTDIAKFSVIRSAMFQKNIYPELYFVTSGKVTDSLRSSGQALFVNVRSVQEFESQFFDYSTYIYARNQKAFGSLINLETGKPEDTTYINVSYYSEKTRKKISLDEIVKKLESGKKLILLGGFGTGKSCCTKQVFDIITSKQNETLQYVLSINLRDHWGSEYGYEITDRHLTSLGIDSLSFRKVMDKPNVIYLLDGFDEMGGQAWSSDKKKMQDIRRRTVIAIKDLLNEISGGCLITGREHFFNSNTEMLSCFGLSDKNVEIIRCNDEFSTDEIAQYLKENTTYTQSIENNLLEWIPRRPLMIQFIANEVGELFSDKINLTNEYDVWNMFIDNLCKREAKISSYLDSAIIKSVMIEVAHRTRFKGGSLSLTAQDLSESFERATGKRPTDETAILLERLPGLGRIDSDSPDRKFVDTYILDGLRAEDIIAKVEAVNREAFNETWKSELSFPGVTILSQHIKSNKKFKEYMSYAVQCAKSGTNRYLMSDLVSALLIASDENFFDFQQFNLSETVIDKLILRDKKISNLQVFESIITELDITNCQFGPECIIKDCIIEKIIGVSNSSGLPNGIRDNEIHTFQSINTNTKVKAANLKPAQEILITILRKVFNNITKGNGRKEEALLRGLAEKDKKLRDKILNKLLTEDILSKHQGDEGYIYSPNRKESSRVKKLLDELTLSDDPLWTYVSNL